MELRAMREAIDAMEKAYGFVLVTVRAGTPGKADVLNALYTASQHLTPVLTGRSAHGRIALRQKDTNK